MNTIERLKSYFENNLKELYNAVMDINYYNGKFNHLELFTIEKLMEFFDIEAMVDFLLKNKHISSKEETFMIDNYEDVILITEEEMSEEIKNYYLDDIVEEIIDLKDKTEFSDEVTKILNDDLIDN